MALPTDDFCKMGKRLTLLQATGHLLNQQAQLPNLPALRLPALPHPVHHLPILLVQAATRLALRQAAAPLRQTMEIVQPKIELMHKLEHSRHSKRQMQKLPSSRRVKGAL